MNNLLKYALAPVVLAVGVGIKKSVQRALTVRELEKAVASNDRSKVESILMFKSHLLPKDMKRSVQTWFDKQNA
jgi:hypothetical protein